MQQTKARPLNGVVNREEKRNLCSRDSSTPQKWAVDNRARHRRRLVSVEVMRWDNLFDDLEGQLEHERTAEDLDLHAEEERLRLGRLSVRDRVVGIQQANARHSHASLHLQLIDGTAITVRPTTIGRDWFSAELLGLATPPVQGIVPLAAIDALILSADQISPSLSPSRPEETERSLSTRLTLSFVLRDLCRRRKFVEVRLLNATLFGTIDRVGRDHLDLAVHEPGSARRSSEVSQYRVIPFDRILLVVVRV